MLLIFDVDGTLTPSRGKINLEFKNWIKTNLSFPFILITGSDPIKTREQIGNDLYESTTVYNCAGNHVFVNGIEQYRSTWRIPASLEDFLEKVLYNSLFEHKTGKHIEHRIGLCNFSTVGRNANTDQRHQYFEWDNIWKERVNLANQINKNWSDVEASVAGETGIDIYKKGFGKSQIVHMIKNHTPLHFFGDRMDPAGNDYSLYKAITDQNLGKCYHVSGWENTWEILKSFKP